MLAIHSQRLRLIALDVDQLLVLQRDPCDLYSLLQLEATPLATAPPDFMTEFSQALEQFCIPKVREHPDRYGWYTHWLIVYPADRRVVGGIGIAGRPDDQGETEVGYYIDHRYEGRGFATEALGALVVWMQRAPDLRAVIAHTPAGHQASQRVLTHNGFLIAGEAEPGVLRWRKPVR